MPLSGGKLIFFIPFSWCSDIPFNLHFCWGWEARCREVLHWGCSPDPQSLYAGDGSSFTDPWSHPPSVHRQASIHVSPASAREIVKFLMTFFILYNGFPWKRAYSRSVFDWELGEREVQRAVAAIFQFPKPTRPNSLSKDCKSCWISSNTSPALPSVAGLWGWLCWLPTREARDFHQYSNVNR